MKLLQLMQQQNFMQKCVPRLKIWTNEVVSWEKRLSTLLEYEFALFIEDVKVIIRWLSQNRLRIDLLSKSVSWTAQLSYFNAMKRYKAIQLISKKDTRKNSLCTKLQANIESQFQQLESIKILRLHQSYMRKMCDFVNDSDSQASFKLDWIVHWTSCSPFQTCIINEHCNYPK